MIQLTAKRYLRTIVILLKIRDRILRRICFEIKKNSSDFYVSTICGSFEEEPPGKVFSIAFLLNAALPQFSGYFLQLNNLG